MAKYCPSEGRRVTYLTCTECDDKITCQFGAGLKKANENKYENTQAAEAAEASAALQDGVEIFPHY